ncbi:MAG: hypothetical protein EXR75_01855 [Myxococcales bacterium]|nr:hypothetical protein [Myxococcales bacterium]
MLATAPAARATRPPSRFALAASLSRLHIVAIGALGTFTFGWLFTGHYAFGLAAISGLDWFLVNLLNRVVDLDEDASNGITGTDFAARHRRAILVVGFSILFSSLAAAHLLWPALLPLRLGFHALGFAYNWPLLPGRRRIKTLYFWKNFASATGFFLTVFLYPLATHNYGLDASGFAPGVGPWTILFAAGFFLLFELSYEVIYDLRDQVGDARAGVRTFPVVHGQAGAVRIIDGLLLGSLACLAVGYALGSVPWRLFIMGAAPLVQLVMFKRALPGGVSSRDCIRLTWTGVLLLVVYHLWIVLGLPGVGHSSAAAAPLAIGDSA